MYILLQKHAKDVIIAYETKSLREISKIYNVTPASVKYFLKKHNIPIRLKGYHKGCTPWNIGIISRETSINNSIKLVESNNYYHFNEATIRKHIKRYLISRNGNKCSICSNTEWQNKPIPLVCDHIDGKHDNRNLSNFRLVCCNCDAQLPTYKSKNRGNGMIYNQKYMQKNKILATSHNPVVHPV